MDKQYWALEDLRYPAGEAEHVKAIAGEKYREIVVKAGDPLTEVSDATIKAYRSMGRKIVTTKAPEKTKAVKA